MGRHLMQGVSKDQRNNPKQKQDDEIRNSYFLLAYHFILFQKVVANNYCFKYSQP